MLDVMVCSIRLQAHVEGLVSTSNGHIAASTSGDGTAVFEREYIGGGSRP